ncbi:MAG: hypothetical protein WC346_02240 [Methanogenium sp.]|jgi:hypothetical protein
MQIENIAILDAIHIIRQQCNEIEAACDTECTDYQLIIKQLATMESQISLAHSAIIRICDQIERESHRGKSIYVVHGYIGVDWLFDCYQTTVLAFSIAEAEQIARFKGIKFIKTIEYCGKYRI